MKRNYISDRITSPRPCGGLGIKNLVKQNEAFILKLCWNLVCNKEALWVRVLRHKYKYKCGNSDMPKVFKKQVASTT